MLGQAATSQRDMGFTPFEDRQRSWNGECPGQLLQTRLTEPVRLTAVRASPDGDGQPAQGLACVSCTRE